MIATKIYYQKCFNLGDYENEVIGIELAFELGDKADDVLEKARYFVNSKNRRKREELERIGLTLEIPF